MSKAAQPVAPHVSKAQALLAEIAAFDPTRSVGRLNPYIDEACAALFGAERWTEYLSASGSNLVFDQDGVRIFDFAPAVASGIFDRRTRQLRALGAEPRPAPLRRLLARHLARQDLTGDAAKAEFATLVEAALADPGPGLLLGGAPRARPKPSGEGPVFAFELGGAGLRGDDSVAGALRLIFAADHAGDTVIPFDGDPLYDAADRQSFAEAIATRTIETMSLARFAGRMFDAGILELPYFGIVERHGLRLMGFAGLAMVQVALLLEARLSGGMTALPQAGAPAIYAPRPLAGGIEGAFDAAWFEAAFAAVKRFFPFTPVGPRDPTCHPYRGADLAEGMEHARCFAFASVALAAEAKGIEIAAGDSGATAELAFWRDGVGTTRFGRQAAHGFVPWVVSGLTDIRIIEEEPLDLMLALRRAKRAAGIEDPLGDVAAAMREEASGFEPTACWMPPGDESQKTTTRFERKVAAARREHFEEMQARRRAGLDDEVPRPERPSVPEGWPTFEYPRQDEILQLVPLDECLPRLKDQPAAMAAYQLEEPWFVAEARARRIAGAPSTSMLSPTEREALIEEHEQKAEAARAKVRAAREALIKERQQRTEAERARKLVAGETVGE